MIDGRQRAGIEPIDSSEDDIEFPGHESIERSPGPAGMSTTEVDLGRPGSCRFEDPRRRTTPFAHQVDDDRLRRWCMDIRPNRVMPRDEVSRADEQPLAIRCQRDPAGGSHEQWRAQSGLEPLDLATERLLGDEQPRRGPGEVQLLGGRHEVAKRADLELVADRSTGGIHAFLMVIAKRQVLDLRARATEGGVQNVLTPNRS